MSADEERTGERAQFLLDDGGGTESEVESEGDFTPVPPPRPAARSKFKSLLIGCGVEASSANPADEYKLYPWRWFMLFSLFLLNVSNGTMWLTFAPIPQYTAVFYGISVDQVDWFSISYFVVSLLIGFLAIVILDIFGLRASLYSGAVFNLSGSVLRWLSSADFVICSSPTAAFAVAMTGQVLTACAQPFLLYAPTKLANFWFGAKERAFCTMLASLGNPLGLAVAQLVSPYVVTDLSKFLRLHLIYTLPAAVGGVLTLVSFYRNKPRLAPAPSVIKSNVPFLTGLKKTLTTPSFLFLMIVWGCGSGLFNAMLTLLAQILCPFGYSDRASGLWGALMVFIGLVGATIGGVVLDLTKLYKEVAVVTLSLGLVCFIWFVEVFSRSDAGVMIAFSISLFGFFGLPLIPACMELGVEITYPVSEATSSGLLWSTTQVVGIILVLLGQQLQKELPGNYRQGQCELSTVNMGNSTCFNTTVTEGLEGVEPQDFTNALLLYAGVGVVSLLVLVVLFRPTYKRLAVEQRAKEILGHLKGPVKSNSSFPSVSPSSSAPHSPIHAHHPHTHHPSPPAHMHKLSPTYLRSTEM